MTERWMRHLRRSISGRTTSDGDIQLVDLRLSRSTSWLIGKHTAARDAASQTAEGVIQGPNCTCPLLVIWEVPQLPCPAIKQQESSSPSWGHLLSPPGNDPRWGAELGEAQSGFISLTHLTSTTLYLCPLPCLTLDTIKIELTAPMDRAFRYL
jgi:hypothetical protein